MAIEENPWVGRFAPILNRDEIRRRVELRPEPIADFGNMSPLEASILIEKALRRVFYPNDQCLDILLQWVTTARAHSLEMYGSHRAFLEGVYLSQSPLPEFCFPSCVTGLAGTGKSTLFQALKRLMPPPRTVTTDDATEFPLVTYRAITVRSCSTPRDILTQFAQREGSTRVLSEYVRRLAYRDGWALLLLDEFQFATQSDSASTRINQMLMAMCYIGVPAVYVANYSLLHKLSSRNQEDRHRLLGKVQVLRPDALDSEDWRTLLDWYRSIAPDVFTFDPEADAEGIHNLTWGVKRSLVALLKIAFAKSFSAEAVVNYTSLEWAYNSREYAPFRSDIEALQKLHGTFRNRRKDLWCPVDEVVSTSLDEHWRRERQKHADAKALEASMTVRERQTLAELSKKRTAQSAKPRQAKVVSIESKKSDAEHLQDNYSWFLDKL